MLSFCIISLGPISNRYWVKGKQNEKLLQNVLLKQYLNLIELKVTSKIL